MKHAQSLASYSLGATVPPSPRIVRVSEMKLLRFSRELAH